MLSIIFVGILFLSACSPAQQAAIAQTVGGTQGIDTIQSTPMPVAKFAPIPVDAPATQAIYAMTRAAADSQSASANATQMWTDATGTAAYIAPTQAEINRQGTATQSQSDYYQSQTEQAQAFANQRTLTAEAQTQIAVTQTQGVGMETLAAIPAHQTLTSNQTQARGLDDFATRRASYVASAEAESRTKDDADWLRDFWRTVGIVFSIVFVSCTIVLVAEWYKLIGIRAQAEYDAKTAKPLAEAHEIDQRGVAHKMTVTGDGQAWASVNGVPQPIGKVIIPEGLSEKSTPVISQLHDHIKRGYADELDYYTPQQQEALELLRIARDVNGDNSRVIPRHDALGIGGEKWTRIIRSLARANLVDNPKQGIETKLRSRRTLIQVEKIIADGYQLPEVDNPPTPAIVDTPLPK